jgi:hypothetical protein
MLFLSVLSLPNLLFAADPIIGTWKLNVAKSKTLPNEEPVKELTETYREIDRNLIAFTYEAIQTDGTKSLYTATWPAEGGAVTAPEGMLPQGGTYVETLMVPGNWYVTVMQDGKQITSVHKVISNDGQMMTQKISVSSDGGK